MRRVPQAAYVPTYLIAVGLNPEHGPEYALRPPY
jgi:hypothetical protein